MKMKIQSLIYISTLSHVIHALSTGINKHLPPIPPCSSLYTIVYYKSFDILLNENTILMYNSDQNNLIASIKSLLKETKKLIIF